MDGERGVKRRCRDPSNNSKLHRKGKKEETRHQRRMFECSPNRICLRFDEEKSLPRWLDTRVDSRRQCRSRRRPRMLYGTESKGTSALSLRRLSTLPLRPTAPVFEVHSGRSGHSRLRSLLHLWAFQHSQPMRPRPQTGQSFRWSLLLFDGSLQRRFTPLSPSIRHYHRHLLFTFHSAVTFTKLQCLSESLQSKCWTKYT